MPQTDMRVTVSVTITTQEGAFTTQEHLKAPANASREQIVENGVAVARRALWDAYESIQRERSS